MFSWQWREDRVKENIILLSNLLYFWYLDTALCRACSVLNIFSPFYQTLKILCCAFVIFFPQLKLVSLNSFFFHFPHCWKDLAGNPGIYSKSHLCNTFMWWLQTSVSSANNNVLIILASIAHWISANAKMQLSLHVLPAATLLALWDAHQKYKVMRRVIYDPLACVAAVLSCKLLPYSFTYPKCWLYSDSERQVKFHKGIEKGERAITAIKMLLLGCIRG